jgi:hypothetical protein
LVSNKELDRKSEKKKLQKGISLSAGFLICHGTVVELSARESQHMSCA